MYCIYIPFIYIYCLTYSSFIYFIYLFIWFNSLCYFILLDFITLPGRLDPLGSPGEGGAVREGVGAADARAGHQLVACSEHSRGGGATVAHSGWRTWGRQRRWQISSAKRNTRVKVPQWKNTLVRAK